MIAAVQPVLRHHGVAAVTGAGEVDHVEVVSRLMTRFEVRVDEVLPGARCPSGPPSVFLMSLLT